MRFSNATKLLFLACVADAFAPSKFVARQNTARSFGVDPSSFADLASFPSISLADALDAAQQAAPLAADVADASSQNNGPFGILEGPIEGLLEIIHNGLVAVGVNENAWGFSIVGMTLLIKLATFPLTKTQLESTTKMQAVAPIIKEVQTKYQSNPEVMNQKIAEVYQQNDVNPLAGCLPAFAQIPVFIGLYRAVLELAKQDKLNEGFLFLPNLEGPTYGADPTKGTAWLFDGWSNGVPSLGWEDTTAFLILPISLVILQLVSTELMQPKDQPQQSNAILKFLPLMIGWFSLNVPAALCVYWCVNTLVTTATTLIIRSTLKVEPATVAPGAPSSPAEASVFAPPPMREKPAGFATDDGVTPITSAIDAEVVNDEETELNMAATGMASEVPQAPKKSRGKKKKKRRKN